MGHPNVEVFLSQIEQEIFKEVQSPLEYSNFFKEEWKAVRSLANDCIKIYHKYCHKES